jgi:beta-glucanase (GH16 family)
MFVSFFLHKKYIVGLLSIILLISCSSDGGSTSGGVTTVATPSNLIVSATVVGKNTQNPNGDGSGVVNFNISATNATSYKISFGDGTVQNTTSGMITFTYKTAGSYNYVVNVTAYNGSNFVNTAVIVVLYVTTSPVWSDEFNINGAPNSSKWGYNLGTGDGGWGNNESQYYTNRSDNVIVSNGSLKIIAKKEDYRGSNYTSARLLTKGKFSFKYGKVEIRAKLPGGGGTWPALWMLGDNISSVGWPFCGEIDIMEYAGNRVDQITAALHYPGRSGGNPVVGNTTITNAETEFHVYSLDWREAHIKMYVDNQLFLTVPNSTNVPFNQNFFLIFNCAMGGSYGGAIDPNFSSSTFEIDYVRVYK